MRKLRTLQPDGFWLVTGASILWGTIGVTIQAIYNTDTTTSLFINLARMVVATPVLLAACWSVVGPEMFQIRQRDFLLMLLGGTLMAVSQAAYFAAIHYTGVTIATLLTICIAPLVVTFLSVLFGETLAASGIAGAVLLILSIFLLSGDKQEQGHSP